MKKERPKVNVCGVPEKDLKDGWCSYCERSKCKIEPEQLVEERVYRFLQKQQNFRFFTSGFMLYDYGTAQYYNEHQDKYEKLPQYMKEYVDRLMEKEKEYL